MKQLIFLLVINLLFISCKKNGYDAELNYDYPYEIEVTTNTESVLGNEIPLSVIFKNKSEYDNPNKEYTLKFSSSGAGYLKNSLGQIYDNTHEIKVVDEGKPVELFYIPTSDGQQTLTLNFINKQNNSVEFKTTYKIEKSSFQLTTVEKDFEIMQGEVLNLTLGITENTTFETPYQLAVNNITDIDYIEINNQKVSPSTFVSLQNTEPINLKIRYNKAGNFNPLIVLKNNNTEFSLPLNVRVNQRLLNVASSSLFLIKANSDKTDLKIINRYNKESADDNSYITPNINIETINKTLFVKFSDTKGTVDKIQYNNNTYYKGDWFLVETSDLKIDSKIKLITKASNYGDESIKIEVKDEFDNEITPLIINYRYYSNPTWIDKTAPNNYYVADILLDKDLYSYKNIRNLAPIKLSGNGAKIVKLDYEVQIGTKHPTNPAGILNISVKKLGQFNYNQENIEFNESWNNLVVYDANVYRQRNSAYINMIFKVTNEFGETTNISSSVADYPALLNFM